MLSRFPTRTLPPKGLSSVLGVAFTACAGHLAQASMLSATPDCRAIGGGWGCYLPGIMRFLVVIAIVLGLILLAVIGVAVKSYFKIRHDDKV